MIYTLNRFTDIAEDSINLPEREKFSRRYGKFIFTFALILYAVSLVMVTLNSTIAGFIAAVPIIIAVLYSFIRLKNIFLIKNILICTGSICSILIVGAYYNDFSINLILLMGIIFISVFINTIIFDIKDVRGDKLCNIRTFPVKYGLMKTKYFCFLLLIPLFLITFYSITRDLRFTILLPFLGYITSYTYFLKDPEQLPVGYFGLYVDGEYIFLLFIIAIFYLFAGILLSITPLNLCKPIIITIG